MIIENLKKYMGVIIGLIALAVYYSTACRSIWTGDSGEFALALNTLGIAHPPGYPLFTLLGRIFVAAFFWIRPIFAAGVFNMVAAAATASIIYYIFRKDIGELMAGVMGLIWAFSPIFWSETIGVEIHTLNILIASLILLALEQKAKWKWAMIIYLFGLALTNHPSSLAFLPAIIYLAIIEKQYRQWKLFHIYAVLFMLAGTLYLYLIIRASAHPVANWGNPESLSSLVRHMSLGQYSGWVNYSLANFLISIRLFFDSILNSWWWIGVFAVAAGIVAGWRVKRQRTIAALLILVSAIGLTASHQALDYEPFYLLPMLASLILMGNIFIWLHKRNLPSMAHSAILTVATLAMAILLLVNYKEMDKSGYTLYEEYGKSVLDTAEEGMVFAAGDINSFPTLYLRYAEGYKPGTEVYDRSIRLSALKEKAKSLTGREYADFQTAREAVVRFGAGQKYLVKNHHFNEPSWKELPVPLFSYGILYAIKEKPERQARILEYPADFAPGDLFSKQLLVNLDLARGEQLWESSDSERAMKAYSTAMARMKDEPRAEVVNQLGIFFRQATQYQLALETYESALQRPIITPSERSEIMFNISNIYKDLGNVCLKVGDYKGTAANYAKALDYDPNNTRLLMNLGIIYAQRLNDKAKAKDYLTRYLNLEPGNADIRRLLNSIQ